MNITFGTHKYWIITGVTSILILAVLFPYSVFNTLDMKVTANEAKKIAHDFLSKEKFSINGFKCEVFLNNSPVENRYILRKLGNSEFSDYIKKKDQSTCGWTVMVHQDLSRQLAQTTFYVYVSSEGEVVGFRREIPDSLSGGSISLEHAKKFVEEYARNIVGSNYDLFKLVESKEENYSKRKDFSFRFERSATGFEGKYVIKATVQGDRVGSFMNYFEVPQAESDYLSTTDAIYGTTSAIFIVFLTIMAFYLFLKKYHQGEIWLSLGRNLFIFTFITSIIYLINLWPAIGQDASVGNLNFSMVKAIIFVINGLVIYFFLSLLVFAAWTVGESYARSLWPEKLKGMDSFFKGHFFSLSSGRSMMQGLVIGILLSLSVVAGSVIFNKHDASIFISLTSFHESFRGISPAVGTLFSGIVESNLTSIVMVFFIVNISYQRWKRKWFTIFLVGIVTMLGFAVAIIPPSLNNFGINLFSYFIFGCFIAYLYFRFDLLTITSALFVFGVLNNSLMFFASSNSFYAWNLIIIMLTILLIPITYLVSLIRKEEFVLENYGLPSHIQRISERERLKKEMEIAAKVQLSLLPKEEPKIAGYDIAATSIPAAEAGGDYFDFVKLSGCKTGIAIGDVSGKGIGAAIYMTLTKGILQAHAEEDVSPKNVLEKVNRLLYKTIEKNSFVSMFYAILDVSTNKIIYSRAGHNPGILTSQDSGGTKLLLSKGMALGLEEGSIFSSTLKEEEFELKHGDICVLYTDGFTEAMNEKNELFGEDRLIHLIEKNRNLSAKNLMNLILKEVENFVSGYPQHDDMTIVVLKRL